VQEITTQFYDGRPDDDPEYWLDDVQRVIWASELRGTFQRHLRISESGTGARILDVGTGRGAFALLLAEFGHSVIGIDGSEDAIRRGRALLQGEDQHVTGRITLQCVNWDAVELSLPRGAKPEGYFDAVVSKQSSCHLYDPIEVFRQWARWLRPGGTLIVIDGLWQRSGWSGELQGVIDELPLSVVSGLGTLTYLVEKGGFTVLERRLLDRVNGSPETRGGSGPLFVLVGKKQLEFI
jgi:SAM-dependent methyltransferase